VFGSSEDEELTAEPEPPPLPAVEAEFDTDPGVQLAALVDEKPEVEVQAEPDAFPLDEAFGEPLATGANGGLRAIDVTPVEIGPDGLVAYEVAQSQRSASTTARSRRSPSPR
jgi:hypothetical protein